MSRSNAAFDYAQTNDASTSDGFDPNEAPTSPSWAEDKNPTRPLPTFRLEEEARRLDAAAAAASAASASASASAAAARFDEDATVTVSAEENKKLLASVFAGAAGASSERSPSPLGDWPCTEEDPTLDAPSPSSPDLLALAALQRQVRITARPPALKSLVITRPAPVNTPRPSVAAAAVIANVATQPLEFPRAAPPLFMALVAQPPASSPAPLASAAVPPSGFRPRIAPELAQAARSARGVGEARRSSATFKIQLPKRNMTTYVVAGIWAMALSLLAVLMFMATSA
jgi:hypothetical protein